MLGKSAGEPGRRAVCTRKTHRLSRFSTFSFSLSLPSPSISSTRTVSVSEATESAVEAHVYGHVMATPNFIEMIRTVSGSHRLLLMALEFIAVDDTVMILIDLIEHIRSLLHGIYLLRHLNF